MEAVERVRARLLRATPALEAGRVTYAVVGGNAVAAWIARVDREAVSFTQDVDILVRRSDFDAVRRALESAGFVYRHLRGVDVFLDGPEGRPRTDVHLIFAGEKVREEKPTANPDPSRAERAEEPYFVLNLAALVQIKLTAFCEKDHGHLCDFLELGLVDATWLDRLPPALAARLHNSSIIRNERAMAIEITEFRADTWERIELAAKRVRERASLGIRAFRGWRLVRNRRRQRGGRVGPTRGRRGERTAVNVEIIVAAIDRSQRGVLGIAARRIHPS